MASIVRYQAPDAVEWARMATGPEIRAALAAIAARGVAIAEAISPRQTGQYSASFRVRSDTVFMSGHTRAAAAIVNSAPYASDVEIRHHVLSRTRDILGAASL